MKRRDFLRSVVPATFLPALLNPFSVIAGGENLLLQQLFSTSSEEDRVLVILFLNGGNDGLNTVIPLDKYSEMSAARSNVLIPSSQVLTLNGQANVGLHPALSEMRNLYNNGKLNIIQSVGYPNPNFSHFRSTDIWTSGSDANQVLSTGWIGRFLDYKFPGFPTGYPNTTMPDPLSVQIGGSLPLMYQSNTANLSMAVSSPSIFNQLVSGVQDPVPATPAGDELEYIRLIASQTQSYASQIINAYSAVTSQYAGYPVPGTNYLADALKVIARLIKGGLKSKVYSVSIGGFDTHSSQAVSGSPTTGVHANLLRMLSQAIGAFQADLEFMSINERVLGMTFSEFGRRIKSNSSLGTDHGAAAPMFLFGTEVQPGILGTNPVLPANASVNDNVQMQYDFRSVYATILKNWFCVQPPDLDGIMLNSWQTLPLLNTTCSNVAIDDVKSFDDALGLKAYPNPFVENLSIELKTLAMGGKLQMFDALGRIVDEKTLDKKPAGNYTLWLDTSHLPAGNYYLRLENGPGQKGMQVIKVK